MLLGWTFGSLWGFALIKGPARCIGSILHPGNFFPVSPQIGVICAICGLALPLLPSIDSPFPL